MVDREVVIINGARTAIGKFGGALKNLNVIDIGIAAVKGAIERSAIKPEDINEVIIGHARQAGTGPNAARIVSVKAGIPNHAPALGVQQACISGLQAVMLAANSIRLGHSEVVLAGGMEHHSSIPYLSMNTRWGARMGNAVLEDAMIKDGYLCGIEGQLMGALADALAHEYGISRAEQEQFALESQRKADAAIKDGFYARVIVPVAVKQKGDTFQFRADEHPRPDTTLERLAKLSPAFAKDGTITAGTSAGITDGACALIVMSKERAEELKLKPLAFIRSYATAGVEPRCFGIGPVLAAKKALQLAGLTLEDIDLIEINEAFAAQVLAVIKDLDLDRSKVNVYGGAIALGHPTGMSGARLTLEMPYALEKRNGRYGLVTICGNGGHGGAMVLERAGD
ncbi:MAG: acetyl-CoA C-acetyltransferase [Dehalococcoidales bacterium]